MVYFFFFDGFLHRNFCSRLFSGFAGTYFYINFCLCRDLLVSFRKATGQKPLRIIFYRLEL